MDYTVAVYTDRGIQKETNQDSLCVRRYATAGGQMLFAVVCDGMGGLQKGELASAQVIGALEAWFDANVEWLALQRNFSQVRRQLTELIAEQNSRIMTYSAQSGAQMGSTMTALLAVGRRYLTVNVGDSRIYAVKGGAAVQLTEDQSLVEREIQQGRITRDEARHHPQRNVLLQCIGAGSAPVLGFTEGAVETDAVYLLCSDGLCHELTETELPQRLEAYAMADAQALQTALIDLTELCKTRGESDNITAVAVRTIESALETPKRPTRFIDRLLGKKEELPPPVGITLLERSHIVHTEETI